MCVDGGWQGVGVCGWGSEVGAGSRCMWVMLSEVCVAGNALGRCMWMGGVVSTDGVVLRVLLIVGVCGGGGGGYRSTVDVIEGSSK